MSGKAWTIFWDGKTEASKLFKFKVSHKNFFRKWFWSDLEIKNECFEHLKMAIFRVFFFFFEWMNEEVETIIWENEAKHQKVFKLKFSHSKLVKKWVRSFFELKNKHCSGVKTAYVIFYKFWLTKLNPFSGKMRQNMKLSLNQNLVMGTFCEKIAYFGFLQHFDCSSWNHLLGK